MSVRLPLVGAPAAGPLAAAARPAQFAEGARIRAERRAVTVGSRDGSSERFARTLAETLAAHGQPAVIVSGSTGQGVRASEALTDALRAPGALVVVSERTLATELQGLLDVWVGPRPVPTADPVLLAAQGSCQLEVHASAEPVARVLGAELAALLASSRASSGE